MPKKIETENATTAVPDEIVPDVNVAEEVVELVAPAKKAKRRKSRAVGELHELPYNKGWTDAETRMYINHLRDELALKTNKIEELKVSCARFNEMYQNCDTAYQRLKNMIKAREEYMKQVVGTAYASLMNMKEIQA